MSITFSGHEAGKLVALITRIFGTAHIQLAEDIVQDTLITAINHWAVGSIPENPAAWLTQVAKRKTINELKRHKKVQGDPDVFFLETPDHTSTIEDLFAVKEIPDSQLRMIFTCCHPALSLESQIALTLKTLCAFGVKEVARALLSNESTINKRLYRAKQKIRSLDLPFDIPAGKQLEERLHAVCLCLYLLFNEGYNSSHPDGLIRQSLCAEAMRLTQLLCEHFTTHAELYALFALMCFHAARFEARIDKKGAIVIFEDQNRALWNQELIVMGTRYLTNASQAEQLSSYHLEAAIAAEHCLAKSFEETDWKSIHRQYERLYQIKKNPIIRLNMAIVWSQLAGEEAAIKKLEALAQEKELEQYYLLPATLGIFYLKLKEYSLARKYLSEAKKRTHSQQEIDFLNQKLTLCE